MSSTHPKVTGTVRSKNPLKGAVEILPERLYYAALAKLPPSHNILASLPRRGGNSHGTSPAAKEKKQIHFFCIDNELVYWNFFLDFGPLNLGQLTRFSKKLNDKLRKFPAVCFYSCTDSTKRANAVFLMCAWQMLYLDRTPAQAYAGFDRYVAHEALQELQEQQQQQTQQPHSVPLPTPSADEMSLPPVSNSQGAITIAPLPDFHDASPCQCTYDLTVLDCLDGMAKARMHGFFDLESFDVEEYEYFEQVENGDLNWLVKDKILAFAGPSFERHVSPEGYCTLAPADYIPYFQQKNVGLVVRLNKKFYNEQDFIDAGIDHVEAFFIDGSCPSLDILHGVIDSFEAVPNDKAFAVHCKAGLGRTGTCIGAYIMKHYGFTAKEVIAWMRICRPGCVIGPQQQYLEKIQNLMWQEGVEAGYIEMPSMVAESTSESNESYNNTHTNGKEANVATSPNSATDNILHDADMPDAVVGRAGQADGLLAARAKRGGNSGGGSSSANNHNGKAKTTTALPSVPVTPESRDKGAIAVTPDTAQGTSLWCG